MTPLQLEIAIWYYGHGDDYADQHDMHGPHVEAVNMLFDYGMIVKGTKTQYVKTDKLDFYITYLLNVPFPEATWIIPQFTIGE